MQSELLERQVLFPQHEYLPRIFIENKTDVMRYGDFKNDLTLLRYA